MGVITGRWPASFRRRPLAIWKNRARGKFAGSCGLLTSHVHGVNRSRNLPTIKGGIDLWISIRSFLDTRENRCYRQSVYDSANWQMGKVASECVIARR